MRTHLLILGVSVFLGLGASAATRTLEFQTKKENGAVHWTPDKIEVTEGETVKIVAKHDLEGGFDVHGFTIPELKIVDQQVWRHKPLVIENVTIPATLKPGEYKVGCQLHPAHVAATLVVKPAK